jgi:hypothetical protein
MTEAEWLACDVPGQMLQFVAGQFPTAHRRLLLTGCAFYRRCDEGRSSPQERRLLEAAEGYADGTVSLSEHTQRADEVWGEQGACSDESLWLMDPACLINKFRPHPRSVPQPDLAGLIRCVFGNPFRLVTVDPAWVTPTAVAIATGVYVERAFDRLPILADALEDAGCDNRDILAHCRGEGPHARGCWVVDLVLKKK